MSAYLNSPLANMAIKPHQSQGSFGATSGGGYRDIHRRPFEVLPWPIFDEKNKFHTELAKLGLTIENEVTKWIQTHQESKDMYFTTLRKKLAVEVLANYTDDIDRLVSEILKTVSIHDEDEKSQTKLF